MNDRFLSSLMTTVGAMVAVGVMVATPAHAVTIGVSSPAVVPTPALLPGLIGMGIAALRQRQAEQRKP